MPIGWEKYIVDNSEEAIDIIKESLKYKTPIAIGRHPEEGLFLISSAGQGPVVLWKENEKANNKQ